MFVSTSRRGGRKMPRAVYKLGTHSIKVKSAGGQEDTPTSEYKELPILTRCLEKTGELLRLDKATEDDIKVIREITTGGGSSETGEGGGGEASETREIVYYRLGSWRADRVILVYEEEQEGEGGGSSSGGGQQGGGGSPPGEEEEGSKKKRRTLRIPIPSWAPNYKVLPTLFQKAQAAGLKVVGAYRHGYMIPAPSQLGRGSGEGGGNQ